MFFTKNRQRLLAYDAGRALFDEVVWVADEEGLLSGEHFSVDGTLIEAVASLKSFLRTHYRNAEQTSVADYLVATDYHLMRLAKLLDEPVTAAEPSG